ncbi:myosin light chain kinase 2, skeletal/cardiac muscle [Hyperolius riggenbachi]|uniref:myosin light chain kinase 2, skeletal/cardiac muscle n=1 Tax=Hyperolius riggenbachi TaxID=752182 RepID=UPI0035A2F47E
MAHNQDLPNGGAEGRVDPASDESGQQSNPEASTTTAEAQRGAAGTPRDAGKAKSQPKLLEALNSMKSTTTEEKTDKSPLKAPPGVTADTSSGAENKGGEVSQIKGAATRSSRKNSRNSLPSLKDKPPPGDVHHPKTNLKLEILKKEGVTGTDRASLDSGTVAVTMPSPGVRCGTPNTPGVFELQSPVVIIGEDVFHIIDDCPPPLAPFPHRFVSLKPGNVTDLYDLNMEEILGGGRFGEVHICTEKATGMQLVAKVLKVTSEKDKEMALNEINVMNELDHRNLIQMFDAIETPEEIFLLLEYMGGGELFERIIDDAYQLMEVDAMVFVRQICEGIFYMHQMYVLHLDLKPENIVCVSPISHMVKIIDFGLARRYKPQNKLKVSFGTPEFLSPEVINFDHVSFPTDMWSVGVITYMMVSGLSPFLGDNETETMNNILVGDPGFEEEPFEQVSEEAKDFISNLLIREKGGRMSAAQCLKHPWLNDLARKAKLCNRLLKSQIELRKYMMRRRWKKNIFAVAAANRFRRSASTSSLSGLTDVHTSE